MPRRPLIVIALMALTCVAAAPEPRPGPDAVWDPPAGAIDRVHDALNEKPDELAAILAGMKSGKATPAAMAFAKRLGDEGGYLGSLAAHGPLLIGELYFPLRANENAEPYVIDAANRLVRPALESGLKLETLSQQPGWKALKLAGNVDSWAPHEAPKEATLESGERELTYDYPLRECHACATVGLARVAFVFDREGKLKGPRLVGVFPPPPPEPEPSARPSAR